MHIAILLILQSEFCVLLSNHSAGDNANAKGTPQVNDFALLRINTAPVQNQNAISNKALFCRSIQRCCKYFLGGSLREGESAREYVSRRRVDTITLALPFRRPTQQHNDQNHKLVEVERADSASRGSRPPTPG